MKRFITISLLVISLCLMFIFPHFITQNEKEIDPAYSKEYIEYLNAEDKSIYGGNIPSMYEETSTYSARTMSTIPAYYCLRDEYMIYTTYQGNYGLCWAYTCNLALETMIAKNYNEFYNFSAAWVGLTTKYYWDQNGYDSYTIGGGGNIDYYMYAVENYGLMLQADFDLKDFYSVDDKNYLETYNNLSQNVIGDMGIDFERVTYSNYPDRDQIKSHIIENGSLYASVKSSDILNQKSLYTRINDTSDHAVSIIGWNDGYRGTDWDNAGAWIALTSWGDDWGNDGIFYISYDDVIANKAFHGFIPKESEVAVEISSVNSSIDNLIVNKYKNARTSAKFENQHNIFNQGEKINLSYGYKNISNLKDITVKVSTNDKIVNNKFSNISTDYLQNTISLDASSLPSGTYKVELVFSLNDGQTYKVMKSFTILNGLELDSLKYNTDATTKSDITNQINVHYANFNSFNQDDLYFDLYANKHCYLTFYLPTYSRVKSSSYSASSGVRVSPSTADFSSFGTTYSNGYLYFLINLADSTDAVANVNITLKNNEGIEKTYYFNIYNLAYNEATLNYTYTNVDYNGATGNTTIPSDIVLSKHSKTYLPTPTKGNAVFEGWYTNPNFTQSSLLPSDANGYYLNYSFVTTNSGTNYLMDHFNEVRKQQKIREGMDPDDYIPLTFNYINLYAKWIDEKYSVTYSWTEFDGTEKTEKTEYLIDECGNIPLKETFSSSNPGYVFKWSSGYTQIDYTNKFIKSLNEDITIYGEYQLTTPTLVSAGIDGTQTTSLSTTYTTKDSYVLQVSASHEASNISYEYNWKKNSDGIYKDLKDSNTNSLAISQASDTGKYICEIVAIDTSLGNNSQPAYSTEFDITINKAITEIDTSSIITEYTYDGEIHVVDGATINHYELSSGNLKYVNNTFKDVGNGLKKVTIIAPETRNYTYAETTVDVKVNKAKVTIKIDNRRGAVFSEHIPYTYEIKYGKVYNNEDLKIEYISNANTYLAGTYEISAVSKNTNYEVEVISGTYSVYIEGLSLVLIISGIAIFIGLVILLIYFIIKKRENDKYLKSSHFDDDIRF